MNLCKNFTLPKWLKVRHVQTFMLFFCLCVNYLMKVNLSIGIVLMTDVNSTASAKIFDWTVAEQSLIQSAFFIGYFFSNLSAAYLVTLFSNKLLLLWSVGLASLLSLMTPVLVTAGGYYVLLVIRILLGLLLGFMMACVMGLMSRWIPPNERGRCGAIILGGIPMGNLLSFSISGWIGDNLGWPSTFYFSGAAAAIWTLLWLIVGADSTQTCSYISLEEKYYINSQLTGTSTLPKNVPVPWREMIKSKPVWAIVLATLGHNWGYWTLVTETPTYFNSVMSFSHTLNGVITALPYACMWIISFPSSYISDFILSRGYVSLGACRKIFNSIGHFGAAICLLILGITTHEQLVIAMYIVGVTCLSCSYIGYNINHLDIVPNFSGFLMGITNGVSNIPAFCAPLFVGQVIHDEKSANEWRIVFFVSAAIFAVGNLCFLVFGSGEEQPFNKIPQGYDGKDEENSNISSVLYAYQPTIIDKEKNST